MTDLNRFFADVASRQFQRTARFRCRIDVGNVASLRTQFPLATRLLREGLVCRSVSIPDRSFESDKVTFYGYEQEYPIYTVYTAVTCEFLLPLNTNLDNEVLHLFHAWHNYILPAPTASSPTTAQAFPDAYRLRGADGFVVETYAHDNSISSRYVFEGVYPHQVSEIQLRWDDLDAVASLQVQFKFMYWNRV